MFRLCANYYGYYEYVNGDSEFIGIFTSLEDVKRELEEIITCNIEMGFKSDVLDLDKYLSDNISINNDYIEIKMYDDNFEVDNRSYISYVIELC